MLTFPPLDGAVGIAVTVLSGLTSAVAPVAGANAAAAAIIVATLLVRVLISPLSYLQVRAERRRAAVAPRVRELHRRYRHDPDRLRAELVALYQAEGASPVGGCLPALLQAPFFLVLYRLATTDSAGIGLLDETLFGIPLGHHLADGLAGAAGPVTAGLFVLLTALAWRLSRRARRALAPADGTTTPGTVALTRLAPLLPYGTLLIAALAPLGAGLYLLTTTAWTALEHAVLRRGGAAAP